MSSKWHFNHCGAEACLMMEKFKSEISINHFGIDHNLNSIRTKSWFDFYSFSNRDKPRKKLQAYYGKRLKQKPKKWTTIVLSSTIIYQSHFFFFWNLQNVQPFFGVFRIIYFRYCLQIHTKAAFCCSENLSWRRIECAALHFRSFANNNRN